MGEEEVKKIALSAHLFVQKLGILQLACDVTESVGTLSYWKIVLTIPSRSTKQSLPVNKRGSVNSGVMRPCHKSIFGPPPYSKHFCAALESHI
jgi:hypothetical protein